MGDLRIDVDAGGLAAKAQALAESEASIPEAFQRTIRLQAGLLALKAAEKALEEPAFGPKHTGLRAAVAAGVGVESTPDGARISTSMPQADESIIPRGLNSGGWRHPVFGHRGTWVRQYGAFSWFTDTIAGGSDDIERGLGKDLDDAAERIARS